MQLIQPITDIVLNLLVQLQMITGNLGVSILLFTFIVRSLILPLAIPSITSQKKIQTKMKEIKPELDALKKKHKNDQKAFQMAQYELYKKYNINPLSVGGCVPQLVQFGLLILLYKVLVSFLSQGAVHGVQINPHFLWFNLSKADNTFVLPILAGITQLILTVMILPGGEIPEVVPDKTKKKIAKQIDKEEEKTADMAAMMQNQMLLMPLITAFFATRFPSGLALYWVATTLYSIVQQYVLAGPGGLFLYTARGYNFVKSVIIKK